MSQRGARFRSTIIASELSELSPFELVTLMIIPEIVSQSLVREAALTSALVGVATLFSLVFPTSLAGYRLRRFGQFIEGEPTLLVRRGELLLDSLHHERVTAEELYAEMHKAGYERLSQVEWAILETDGKIAFIPRNPTLPTPPAAHEKRLA